MTHLLRSLLSRYTLFRALSKRYLKCIRLLLEIGQHLRIRLIIRFSQVMQVVIMLMVSRGIPQIQQGFYGAYQQGFYGAYQQPPVQQGGYQFMQPNQPMNNSYYQQTMAQPMPVGGNMMAASPFVQGGVVPIQCRHSQFQYSRLFHSLCSHLYSRDSRQWLSLSSRPQL